MKGFHVIEAETVCEGINGLKNNPDWIILDIMLPDGSGVSVLKECNLNKLPAKVIVTSGAHEDELMAIRNFNPFLILQKPFDIDKLLRLLAGECAVSSFRNIYHA